MAIALYSGLSGSGKSYEIVKNQILPALKEGRAVYTNIPLKYESLMGCFPNARLYPLFKDKSISPSEQPWPDFEEGALIIIDEAWEFWPAGQRLDKVPVAQRDFFAMQRHKTDADGKTQQVVIAIQSLDQLANWLKGQVHTHYACECLDYAGKHSSYRVNIYRGAKSKRLINQSYGTYSPEVWCFYNSNSQGEGISGKKGEAQLDTRMNLLRTPLLKFGVPLGALVVCIAVYQLFSFFSAIGDSELSKQTKDSKVAVSSATAPRYRTGGGAAEATTQVIEVKPSVNYSTTWRIAGVLIDEKTGKKLITAVGRAGYRNIDSADCELKNLQWYCNVDNEIVTSYTGQNSRNSFVTSSVEHSSSS